MFNTCKGYRCLIQIWERNRKFKNPVEGPDKVSLSFKHEVKIAALNNNTVEEPKRTKVMELKKENQQFQDWLTEVTSFPWWLQKVSWKMKKMHSAPVTSAELPSLSIVHLVNLALPSNNCPLLSQPSLWRPSYRSLHRNVLWPLFLCKSIQSYLYNRTGLKAREGELGVSVQWQRPLFSMRLEAWPVPSAFPQGWHIHNWNPLFLDRWTNRSFDLEL